MRIELQSPRFFLLYTRMGTAIEAASISPANPEGDWNRGKRPCPLPGCRCGRRVDPQIARFCKELASTVRAKRFPGKSCADVHATLITGKMPDHNILRSDEAETEEIAIEHGLRCGKGCHLAVKAAAAGEIPAKLALAGQVDDRIDSERPHTRVTAWRAYGSKSSAGNFIVEELILNQRSEPLIEVPPSTKREIGAIC